jgi:hypothetical protein
MPPTITCTSCGTVLGIPKAGMPKDGMSCNWCGYVNTPAPTPVAVAAPKREAVTTPAEPLAPAAEPYKWGDGGDDDGEPYSLPPEEIKTRPCTSCGRPIDRSAVVCVHCGYHAEAKQKVERTFHPIDREWESGWPLKRRLAVLIVFQVLNVATIAFGVAVGGTVSGSISATAFYVVLQAFLVGTYDSVRIRRNQKGKAEITITWRVCFVPMAPKKVKWRDHEGIAVGLYHDGSVFDWVIFFDLFFFGIVPAILWWYYVMRADHVYAALCRDRGYPETYLYRGVNQEQAKEIAQVATDATSLPLTTPL